MEKFKITRNTALNWAKNKKLPNAFKIGMDWKIPKSDVHTTDKMSGIKEVREIFNLNESTIYIWVKDGKFPNAVKTSSGWKIPRDGIDIYLYRKSLLQKESPCLPNLKRK